MIIGLAVGAFFGNLLFWGLGFRDWKRGFWVGILAGIIIIAVAPFLMKG